MEFEGEPLNFRMILRRVMETDKRVFWAVLSYCKTRKR